MARRDIRYTPTYQFWLGIGLSVVIGAVAGWCIDHGWDAGLAARAVLSSLIGVTIAIGVARRRRAGSLPHVTGYEHPILGLYAGLAALLTASTLGVGPLTSLTGAAITGVVVAGLFILARRWTVRRHEPVPGTTPTITGWR